MTIFMKEGWTKFDLLVHITPDGVARRTPSPAEGEEGTAPFIDDGYLGESPIVCGSCAHFDYETKACGAFPEGIPLVIWAGINKHRHPFPGDNGIRFAPKDDQSEQFVDWVCQAMAGGNYSQVEQKHRALVGLE